MEKGSFMFAEERGFSLATGPGPDSKWSIAWGRMGTAGPSPTLGAMTFHSSPWKPGRGRSSTQPKLLPRAAPHRATTLSETPKGVGGTRQLVPATHPTYTLPLVEKEGERGLGRGRCWDSCCPLQPLPWLLAPGEGIATGEQLRDRAAS